MYENNCAFALLCKSPRLRSVFSFSVSLSSLYSSAGRLDIAWASPSASAWMFESSLGIVRWVSLTEQLAKVL
jgi:hypothetical protein